MSLLGASSAIMSIGAVTGAGIGGLGGGIGGAAFGAAFGLQIAGKQLGRMAFQGTAFTNPVFPTTSVQGYGKRGIDANNMNTNGLSLGLHKNRRKF